MKSYSEKTIFTRREIRLWTRATKLVTNLVEPRNRQDLRCHEVARAVGDVLGLTHIDGKFGFTEHTWLSTVQTSTDKPNILDVYAVGMLPMVLLVDAHHGTLEMPKLYKPFRKPREDIREDVVDLLVKQMT